MIQSHETVRSAYISVFTPINFDANANENMVTIDIYFIGQNENFLCGQFKLHQHQIPTNDLISAINQLMNSDVLLTSPNENNENDRNNLQFHVVHNNVRLVEPIVQLTNAVMIDTHNQQWTIRV